MTTWAFNKRSKITHAVSGGRTLCNWWVGRMLPVEAPPDVTRICYECSVKLRQASGKRTWSKPLVYHLNAQSFTAKIGKRERVKMIQSIKLEAAQRGFWGRI